MTKDIWVEVGFKLPRLPIDVFKKLSGVIEYNNENGKGIWTVRKGQEREAVLMFEKYFAGVRLWRMCEWSGCKEYWQVEADWDLIGRANYDEHIDVHRTEDAKSKLVFSDCAEFRFREDEVSKRRCHWCGSKMIGIYVGWEYIVFKCSMGEECEGWVYSRESWKLVGDERIKEIKQQLSKRQQIMVAGITHRNMLSCKSR